MKIEKRGGFVFVESRLTDSSVRLEMQEGGLLCLCFASRDNTGRMHIESAAIPLSDIQTLPVREVSTYRSPTDEERQAMRVVESGEPK